MSGALPWPYVLERVTRGALVAHRHSFLRTEKFFAVELLSTAEPLCQSQSFIGTIFVTQNLMVWDFGDFKGRTNTFLLNKSALSFCLKVFSLFFLS